MGEDAVECVPAGAHGSGSNLAEAYAVAPAGTVQDEPGRYGGIPGVNSIHNKCRAVQMRLGQPAAYLEFLAYGGGPQRAPDEQFDDASGGPAAQWSEFQHRAEVNAGAAAEQVAELLLRVFDPPAVEIGGLLVVGIQDGGEQGWVGGVASRAGSEVLQKASGEDNIHLRAVCSSESSGRGSEPLESRTGRR